MILANVAYMKLHDLYTHNHGPYWCGVMYSATSKFTCLKEINLRFQILLTTLDSIVNTIGRTCE